MPFLGERGYKASGCAMEKKGRRAFIGLIKRRAALSTSFGCHLVEKTSNIHQRPALHG